jgi:diacylglycerol kinase (ATP)
MNASDLRRVRVLINRRSGALWSAAAAQEAIEQHFGMVGREITHQFTHDEEDGRRKAGRAVQDRVDLLLVVGGDGTINTIGSELIGTQVCLGTIPAGSGNGLARHFGIPLAPDAAASCLAAGRVQRIDVGRIQGRPFFVTCGIAWDAAIVRTFERMPLRGILPYVFAGAYELFDYRPQPVDLDIDGVEQLHVADPLIFTAANLTQYGGGAVIAPQAQPDDGLLDLVIARRQHVPQLLASIGTFLSGAVMTIPQVIYRRFRRLTVRRPEPADVQLDGERMACPAELVIEVSPQALSMLVPPSDIVTP